MTQARIYRYRIIFPAETGIPSLMIRSPMHAGPLFRGLYQDVDITKCRFEKIDPPVVIEPKENV